MKNFNPIAVGKNPKGQPRKRQSSKSKKESPVQTQIRYSDEDLDIFKNRILPLLEQSKKEEKELRERLSEISFSNSGPKDSGEEGKCLQEKVEAENFYKRAKSHRENLEKALVMIEQKNYGICRQTGKLIPKERLLVAPHATLCVEAKNINGKH